MGCPCTFGPPTAGKWGSGSPQDRRHWTAVVANNSIWGGVGWHLSRPCDIYPSYATNWRQQHGNWWIVHVEPVKAHFSTTTIQKKTSNSNWNQLYSNQQCRSRLIRRILFRNGDTLYLISLTPCDLWRSLRLAGNIKKPLKEEVYQGSEKPIILNPNPVGFLVCGFYWV